MALIKSVWAREILDSRGHPTISTTIYLDNGMTGSADVPSGATVGNYEAVELRDGDPGRYHGMGVMQAVENVNSKIGPALVGKDPVNQAEIDDFLIKMDGTENKASLGANTLISVSQAACVAGAAVNQMPAYRWVAGLASNQTLMLPVPLFNMINGGRHGNGNLDFQEFLLVPHQIQGYRSALRFGAEVYMKMKEVLGRHKTAQSVGDEGGFVPNLFTNLDAFAVLKEAIEESGFTLGKHFVFGMDVAATEFYQNEKYKIRDYTNEVTASEMVEFYKDTISQYPVFVIEDGMAQDDLDGWQLLMNELGGQLTIVGDDLVATNKKRLQQVIDRKLANAIIVKPNELGTISETLELIQMARQAGLRVMVTHRSGETNDTFIADLAVGVSAEYVKFGAPARGERVAKYNRLSVIDEELGK